MKVKVATVQAAVLLASALNCCTPAAYSASATTAPGAALKAPVRVLDLSARLRGAKVEDGVKVVKDVAYAPGGAVCSGDFYLPSDAVSDGNAPRPAVIVVHGGAWSVGSKEDGGEVDIAKRLAQHGYVTFSINYHLVKDNGLYPTSVNDVRDAWAFVVKNADKLNIDTSRLALYGGSVGSMLVMLATFAPPEVTAFKAPHYADVTLPRPKAVATYSALTDIRNLERTWIFKYMDDTPWHSPELYVQASPITYVKNGVPTLFVHGENDYLVPIDQSQNMAKALQDAGIHAEVVVIPHCRHGFHEEPGPKRELAFAKLVQFLDKNVK